MTETEHHDLRYPIGTFSAPSAIHTRQIEDWIQDISDFPAAITRLTQELSPTQKSWRYRPGGWMIKQVVHHCVDSHLNSIIRFKLALTEDNPTIRPYEEQLWAELSENRSDGLEDSLLLLQVLHRKWVRLLRSLNEAQLQRTLVHPATGKQSTVAQTIGLYAWHSNHHLAHIRQALAAKGTYNEELPESDSDETSDESPEMMLKNLGISAEVLHEIAGELSMGFLCYVHKETRELISVPDRNAAYYEEDELWNPLLERIDNDFDEFWELRQMPSRDSFQVMEAFAEQLNNSHLRGRLLSALGQRKPFRKFKDIVDDAGDYREAWFAFKDQQEKEALLYELHSLWEIEHQEEEDEDEDE